MDGKVSYSRVLYGVDRSTVVGQESGTGTIEPDGTIALTGSSTGRLGTMKATYKGKIESGAHSEWRAVGDLSGQDRNSRLHPATQALTAHSALPRQAQFAGGKAWVSPVVSSGLCWIIWAGLSGLPKAYCSWRTSTMTVRISALTIMAPLNRTSKTVRASERFWLARGRCGKFVGKGYLHLFSPAFRA